VLKTDLGKQAVPDLACVNARGQKVVGGLIILVAQSTVGVWLEPMEPVADLGNKLGGAYLIIFYP
jgi:hypothetical protein